MPMKVDRMWYWGSRAVLLDDPERPLRISDVHSGPGDLSKTYSVGGRKFDDVEVLWVACVAIQHILKGWVTPIDINRPIIQVPLNECLSIGVLCDHQADTQYRRLWYDLF